MLCIENRVSCYWILVFGFKKRVIFTWKILALKSRKETCFYMFFLINTNIYLKHKSPDMQVFLLQYV